MKIDFPCLNMPKNQNSRSNNREKYLKYCRHVLQGRNCRVGRCPFIHDLNVRIPCPFEGNGCKFFGQGKCRYYHHVDEMSYLFEDMKTQLQSFLEISFRYESSKLLEKLERMVMPSQEMMQGEPALESKVEDEDGENLIKLLKFEVELLEQFKVLSSFSEESEANQKDQLKVSCE